MKNKSSGQLRAFRAAGYVVALSFFLSCTAPDDFSSPCVSGDCDAKMIFPVSPDKNGYYHMELNWTREFLPYFMVEVEADVILHRFRYNGVSHVTATFDSNASWFIGSNLVFVESIYNPFTSNTTNAGNSLPIATQNINLAQFSGVKVNVVQGTGIKFNEKNGKLYSKRTVGPIPPSMIGDTITLFMKVFWDAGMSSQEKDHYKLKFIVE